MVEVTAVLGWPMTQARTAIFLNAPIYCVLLERETTTLEVG